ncbi:MAG: hypothetical protein AAFN78_03525 [Pseudomonadota bacterium]
MENGLKSVVMAAAAVVAFALPASASAEIVSSSETHFVLRHEASSALSAEALWQRLLEPASWWHPDHTYSGSAQNLSLEPRAGGMWRETWDGGSVVHGTVLFVKSGSTLRMNAPFGPLQELGAYTIWTITITSADEGSTVVFDEVSSGPPSAGMAEIAKAVDFVKAEAIRRLTQQ